MAHSAVITEQEVLRLKRRHGPIDMEFLDRQTLGDPGLRDEVLRLFDTLAHVYFGRLERSTTVPDLLMHLHTLKGAAAGIGAKRLMGVAAAAEAALREGLPVDPEWVDDVEIAIEEVSVYIGDLIEEQATH